MIRLLRVELTRLRWRRAVFVLALASIVVPIVIAAVTLWDTRPVSDADLRRAQQQVAQDKASGGYDKELARCLKHPGRYGANDFADESGTELDPEAACHRMIEPQVDWYLYRNELDLGQVRKEQGVAATFLVAAFAMLIGTTFAGADWNSGSMSNQLLFDPRRVRVWTAKALAVLLGTAVLAVVSLGIFWGLMYGLAQQRDLLPSQHVDALILWQSLRSVVLAAFAALGALAITMLFRSTVFTLGLMFAVVIGATIVVGLIPSPDRMRWDPGTNVGAWVLDGVHYYRQLPSDCYTGRRPPAGLDCREQGLLTMWPAARYLGALMLVAVVASVGSFRRRDVP